MDLTYGQTTAGRHAPRHEQRKGTKQAAKDLNYVEAPPGVVCWFETCILWGVEGVELIRGWARGLSSIDGKLNGRDTTTTITLLYYYYHFSSLMVAVCLFAMLFVRCVHVLDLDLAFLFRSDAAWNA